MKVKHILLAAMCCTAALCAQAQSTAGTFTRNRVLIEKHTGLSCQYCPDGDRLLKAYIDRHPEYQGKFVEMRHNSYSGDMLTVPFHMDIRSMWSPSGFPKYYVDRCHPMGWKGASPQYYELERAVFMYDETDEIANRLAKPTNVSLSFSGSAFNPSDNTLTVRVSGAVTASLPDLHISVFLVQDGIYVAYKGETYDGTSRAFLTNSVHGDFLPVAGGRYDVAYTYTIPAKLGQIATDPSKMRVVAFVSSFDDTDFTNSEVHNCDVVSVTSLSGATPRPRQQCVSPTIELQGQQLVLKSPTPGAVYFYSVTSNVTNDFATLSAADLSKATFTVTAYSGAPGYNNSPTVTKSFTLLDLIGDKKDVNGDGIVSVADVPSLIKLLKK